MKHPNIVPDMFVDVAEADVKEWAAAGWLTETLAKEKVKND